MRKALLIALALALPSCHTKESTYGTPRASDPTPNTGAFVITTPASGGKPPAPQNLPNGPPVCATSECGPAPMYPTQRCPDGQHVGGRGPCVRFANGRCGWTHLVCPAATEITGQAACTAADCAEPIYSRWSCPDQSIGEFQCVRSAQGRCGMTYRACAGFAQSSTPPLTSPPSPPPSPPPPAQRSCDPLPSIQEASTWPIGSMCSPGGGPDPGDVRELMTLGDGTHIVNANGRCLRVRYRTCHSKCLPPDALISTPSGDVAIRDMRIGMAVWTRDTLGKRIVGYVDAIANPAVPAGHYVERIALADGRSLTASPVHPVLNNQRIQDLQVGDVYDGSPIIDVQILDYVGTSTYDILPSGETGVYWVNGIPMASTIER